MRKRIALGSVGAAALLGLLVLWGAIVAKPVRALEKMAENIRQAKSLKYKMIVQITQDLPGPKRDGSPNHTGTSYTGSRLARGGMIAGIRRSAMGPRKRRKSTSSESRAFSSTTETRSSVAVRPGSCRQIVPALISLRAWASSPARPTASWV